MVWQSLEANDVSTGRILATAGVALGVGLAWATMHMIGARVASDIPELARVTVGGRAILFAFVLSVCLAAIAGALPAWRGANADPTGMLRGSRTSNADREGSLNTMVIAEVALSLVLVIGASLVLKAFMRLLDRDPGFDPTPVLTLKTSIAPLTYADGGATTRFLEPALSAIAQIPGVDAVGAISHLPFREWGASTNAPYEGRTRDLPATQRPSVEIRFVTPGYFAVTRQHLIEGRLLDERDAAADAPAVVVANEALARRDFPGEDAVGKRFYTRDSTLATIIGVVSTIRNAGPIEEPRPEFYYPYQPGDGGGFRPASVFNVMVRVRRGDPQSITSAVTAAFRSIDPRCAVSRVMPMRAVMAESVRQQRFFLWLIVIFAVVAVILAISGLHGVLSYAVAQRTRELGIRTALGSTALRTIGLVAKRGVTLIAAGVGFGLAGGFAVTRLLQSTLYGVDPLDGPTWTVATAVMATLALLATIVPSLRAAGVDPIAAMRAE